MARIQVGEGSIHYERHGDGFPVMFISGLSGVASFWKDQVAAFARKFDVITHDHRGIGQSDVTRSGYTVDRMAADVIGLMDALEVKRAHLVGHSTGGAIAQILALDHPNRVASIVLSGSWTKPDAYFRRFYGLRKDILLRLGPSAYVAANSLFLYPAAYVAKNNEKLRQAEAQTLAVFPPTEIAASRIDAILAFDRTEQLNKIKTPTLVIGAEDDLITPAYFSEELARLIRGAEVKLFPSGGHSFTQVRAREFNQAVLPFLAAHTPNEP
jgi:aminoacrylate hydrolase